MRSRRTQNRTETTGGGGLEPSAANTKPWDRVPDTETHRTKRAKCQQADGATAQSSKCCTKNRPNAPCLSTFERQLLTIAQVIELRRKNQSVNAQKRNGASAQTAREGRVGARAGSPGAIGRPGGRRQSSARRNQT